jgi:hypothetical protein
MARRTNDVATDLEEIYRAYIIGGTQAGDILHSAVCNKKPFKIAEAMKWINAQYYSTTCAIYRLVKIGALKRVGQGKYDIRWENLAIACSKHADKIGTTKFSYNSE